VAAPNSTASTVALAIGAVGGAVKGGRLYGTFPDTQLGSRDEVGEARLVPSTLVDEYAATILRCFGVTAFRRVLPHLGRFAQFNMDIVFWDR
jgi:uncharacterized protein (DUF1501 family)